MADGKKAKITPTAKANLAGKLGSSVIDNGADLLKTFYEKSGESKKIAAIKEWEELRDKGTISEEDFQLKKSGLLGKKSGKESSLKPKEQEKLESSLKIKILRDYKSLFDDGVVTEEQFLHQKLSILAEKLPKSLDSHEVKIEAIQLYEQLKDENILNSDEFEKIKDKVFGISHQEKDGKKLLTKVTSIFPMRKKD